ncbi:MAG TPA: FtsX-like permease family protein, partial [Rubricoccaceae bacterium]|nr:FtsX-like permease family protein [Rubricoccaceae bacterium]
MPFTFTLAWRDSRRMRRRLLLYVSAMALGVAALVAIRSFGVNLQRALGEQAREVFGADLRLYTDGEFSEDTEAFLDSLTEATGAERAREVTLASMALFPESGGTRLAQVRALRGDYPFYGGLETLPAEATEMWQRKGAALVDAALLLQYGAEVGDTVRIGARAYPVAGQIEGITGQTDVGALVGPRVYIPLDDLDPGLLGFGSRSSFTEAFRLEDVNPDTLLNRLRPELDRLGLRGETVSGAQGDWAEGLSGLTRFLELVGFIALLLGGLGVASAIHVYVRQKAEAVATLRCLGATAGQTLRVFTLQAAALGLLAALLGAVLGVGIQALLPRVLGPFLPVEVAVTFVWEPVLVGVGVGLAVALAFALFPLLSVRRIPPLRALRADAEAEGRDPLRGLLALALAAGVGVFAWAQTGEWEAGVGFPLAVLVALAVLALTARLLQALVRRAVPRAWPYTWRQGLANLHRPGNQTLVLLLTLGLGTFLLLTLTLIEQALLAPIAQSEATTQADVVLFDIQPDQRDSVRALVEAQGLPVVDEVPIVPMQLDAINGRSVTELVADSTDRRPRWALEREYRSTFRDHPIPTEEVIAGEFVPRVAPNASPIPISV